MSRRPCGGGHKNYEIAIANTGKSRCTFIFFRDNKLSALSRNNLTKILLWVQICKPPTQGRRDKLKQFPL